MSKWIEGYFDYPSADPRSSSLRSMVILPDPVKATVDRLAELDADDGLDSRLTRVALTHNFDGPCTRVYYVRFVP
jgi:hypothetical protein